METHEITDGHKVKWSGKKAIPALESIVKIRMNHLGTGEVIRYEIHYGGHDEWWIGLRIRLMNPPEWWTKQNPDNPLALVFGVDL